jgi:hypothetical protein
VDPDILLKSGTLAIQLPSQRERCPRCTRRVARATRAALPNWAVPDQGGAANAAPLARLPRRAQPWGGPPGASRATPRRLADQDGLHVNADPGNARSRLPRSRLPSSRPSRQWRLRASLRSRLRRPFTRCPLTRNLAPVGRTGQKIIPTGRWMAVAAEPRTMMITVGSRWEEIGAGIIELPPGPGRSGSVARVQGFLDRGQ